MGAVISRKEEPEEPISGAENRIVPKSRDARHVTSTVIRVPFRRFPQLQTATSMHRNFNSSWHTIDKGEE
jgi:hypothetical protein